MTRLGWLHSFTTRRAVPLSEFIDISLTLLVTITMNQGPRSQYQSNRHVHAA